MGEYLVTEALTPPSGKYPSFTRSTGRRDCFPLPEDAGSQSDRPFEIEPDKGGVAGYALARLAEATGERKYLDQALRNARVLAANQQQGDAFHSPWPFRADFRTGEARGPVSGNTAYILRLYDALIARGFGEFLSSRALLWRWIKDYQLPSAQSDGALFAQFFEDHDTPTNRTAWAPLNLARYLLEKKECLHREWRADCDALVDFVRRTFTHRELGVTVCHEQDEDKQAWGGVVSTYGAVLAMYADAVGSAALAHEARSALNFALYAIDGQGRPRDLFMKAEPGGWQEDAHTDVIHNVVDALRVNPTWGIDEVVEEPAAVFRSSGRSGYTDAIRDDARHVEARKRPGRVEVRFADTECSVQTPEGIVHAKPGDAILAVRRGSAGACRALTSRQNMSHSSRRRRAIRDVTGVCPTGSWHFACASASRSY